MKEKLTSRKFWLCVAAFLGSIAISITGLSTSNDFVVTLGIICATLSAAIYAACEAAIDKAAVTTSSEETDDNTDTQEVG